MSWDLLIILILVIWIVCWSIAVFILDGPSHHRYDSPTGELFDRHPDDTKAEHRFIAKIHEVRQKAIKSKSLKTGLAITREFADNLSNDLETETLFSPAASDKFEAEWAIAPGVDTDRRVLFFHGGAFIIGSPVGHRKFSDRLSRLCNAAVLSVNYRMLPEHPRRVSTTDAQLAYQWIIENSPTEKKNCEFLIVSGDSAGGNFAFMLSSWSKYIKLRRPDAVIGFSPTLDSTMSSPTVKENRKSDKILGPSLGKLSLLPRPFQLWLALLLMRTNPSSPDISPLFYDLNDLPPTLIQASHNEMLVGDAVRYANKATAVGSDVTLQIWRDQIHDWQLFNMGSGSAEEAWSKVEEFINRLKR